MRILFIGQNPSQTNIDENVAFIGSKSYIRLKDWIRKLNLLPEAGYQISFVNASRKIGQVALKDIDENGLVDALLLGQPDKIITLGNYATKGLIKVMKKLSWKDYACFQLPHPSGLNRKLNDANYVNMILERCREYIDAV